MNKPDNFLITCVGEILVDMIQENNEQKQYQAHPGGAPANVAIGISKLGGDSAFMGKIGQDSFGRFLFDTLTNAKVNLEGLSYGEKTGMSLVSLDEKGERGFEFYGDLTSFSTEDINYKLLDKTDILHFGSISLIKDPEESATLDCLEYFREKGRCISFDPNLRLNLWSSVYNALRGFNKGLAYADIIKVSEYELAFMTEIKNVEKGTKKLHQIAPNLKLIAVTMGDKGCYCYYKGIGKTIPSINVDVVDSTGAGDGFMAGLLYNISELGGLDKLEWPQLEASIYFANVVGALTTTKKGAVSGFPSKDEIEKYL